jgi:hypothetical protein
VNQLRNYLLIMLGINILEFSNSICGLKFQNLIPPNFKK